MTKPVKTDKKTEVETTGHSWDGIEELNNPLPRWWLYTFYLCIIFALGYSVAYPAWPMLTRATPGFLGDSTRQDVADDIARFDAANTAIKARLVEVDLTAIAQDPTLLQFATNQGAAIFRTNCAQCHGLGAAGVQQSGYPNLLDDDWLWGGDINAIHTTITHGIRNRSDPDAGYSQMPNFGTDALLSKIEIAAVAQYLRLISGQDYDAALVSQGAALFKENCAVCHGDAGLGNRDLGAPNLTDAIWLYGGSTKNITASITKARFGVMPNWSPRLSEDAIRAVAIYVHGLGGGG